MIVYWILLLAPILPLTGLQLGVFHVAAFLSVVSLLAVRHSRIRLRAADFMLAFFAGAYCLSLVAALAAGASGSRVWGSAYNMSYWLMGLALLIGAGNTDRERIVPFVLRGAHKVFVAACAFGVLAVLLWIGGQQFGELRAPFVPASGIDSQLIASSTRIRLVQPDYLFGRFLPRTSAFVNYPTAYGAVLVLCGMASLAGRRLGYVKNRRAYRLLWPVFGLGLAVSGSRGALLGAGAAAIVWALASRRSTRAVGGIAVGIAALIVAASLVRGDLARSTGNDRDRVRYGSTQARISLYEKAYELWRESPLVGIGVKPLDRSEFAVGSHSTYVGLLLRTGVVGVLLFVAFMLAMGVELWRRLLSARDRASAELVRLSLSALAFGAVWMIGEDLDAPQLVAFLFFAILAISRTQPSAPRPRTAATAAPVPIGATR